MLLKRIPFLMLLIILVTVNTGCVRISRAERGGLTIGEGKSFLGTTLIFSGDNRVHEEGEIYGPVLMTDGRLWIDAKAGIGGPFLMTDGKLLLGPESGMAGVMFINGGEAVFEAEATITGIVFISSGDVYLEPGAKVFGNIILTNTGTLKLGSDATILGNVFATSGSVILEAGSSVAGKIYRVGDGSISIDKAEAAEVWGGVVSIERTIKFAQNITDAFAGVVSLVCITPLVIIGAFLLLLIAFLSRKSRSKYEDRNIVEELPSAGQASMS
jgi:hypothetical protein